MQMKEQAEPSRWHKLRHLRLLTNDRKTQSFAYLGPFASAFRFSARFGGSGRGPQLRQQLSQATSHLLRSTRSLFVFPQTQLRFHQRTRKDQMIMGQSYDVGPKLKLFWGTQARFLPQQRLLVQTVAVFLSTAQRVAQRHLRQISLLVANPDKPADPWVALLVAGMRTHHSNDGQIQPASFFD